MKTFTYKNVTVESIHDGDTFTARIPTGMRVHKRVSEKDLGLHLYVAPDGMTFWRWPVRLNGCNAPEISTPQGPPAKNALTTLLESLQIVSLTTHLPQLEKYGRVLGDVILSDGTDVSQWMIDNGFAVPYTGGAR